MTASLFTSQRRQELYRRIAVCAIAVLVLMDVSSHAQTKKRKGPRAIAVVRWDADARDRAVPVLVPVTILDEGRFYDAGIYKAAPAPLPLLAGTVYEAQDKGELLGYFTIKRQTQTREKRNWIALGAWESAAPKMELQTDNRRSSAEVVRGPLTENTGANAGENNDDRDLNKKKTTVYDENGNPMPEGTQASPAAPMGGAGKDHPTLKRGDSPKPVDTSKQADSKKSSDDPDRPALKRQGDSGNPPPSAPNTKGSSSPVHTTSASDDSDRPELKHGRPTTRTQPGGLPQIVDTDKDADRPVIRRNTGKADAAKKDDGIPVPPRVLDRGPLLGEGGADEPTLKRTRTYEAVAVSDANVDLPVDFRYKMTSDEKERMQAKLDALAQDEVERYLKSIRQVKPAAPKPRVAGGKSKPALTAAAKSLFAETQFEVLDLNHRNDAVLVFSGRERAEMAGFSSQDVYVVYVARIDFQGNPRGIFRSVTVNDRMDVTPKLELIDAVDALGDGNGELLFRRVSDVGAEFAIYKVTFDGMTEIFQGGTAD